jgi:hypothetical protein
VLINIFSYGIVEPFIGLGKSEKLIEFDFALRSMAAMIMLCFAKPL